jgi:Tol biopolymer transport system component
VAGIAVIVTIAAFVAWRARPIQDPAWAAPTRLTHDDGLQTEPGFSPDGTTIVYTSDRSGNFDIWTRRIAGGDAVQVTRDAAADSQPDWSPDGNRIVFRSERAGGGLFVVPATGGAEQQLSTAGFNPRWSPDGNHILFAGKTIDGLDLQVIDADGGSPRRWPGDAYGGFGWQPASSTVLVFSSPSGSYEPRLTSWVLGAASSQKWQVDPRVRREFWAQQLSVVSGGEVMSSADMTSLYFVGVSRGTTAVWRIGLDATTRRVVAGPRRITTVLDANTACHESKPLPALFPPVKTTWLIDHVFHRRKENALISPVLSSLL